MEQKKLLVVTAGTVAAGVGQAFLKQMQTHSVSQLDALVRYIDTSYLPDTYGDIHRGEWFHMSIDSQFMNAISKDLDRHYPQMKKLLYPNLLPETDGTGGGSIRYNSAGAMEAIRGQLKLWLKNSMTDLANRGNRSTEIAIALVISSVGATGSGAVERLTELLIEAAHDASIPTPIQCDVFVMLPGMQGVTELGLANTLALFAEMAATRLSASATVGKRYRGRTMLVGWGSGYTLSSIKQLQETVATLVRLMKDTVSGVASQHQGRQIDKHVLREADEQTGLPSHLSSATPVTIGLGDLEEQILKADIARILHHLIFDFTSMDAKQKRSNAFAGLVSLAFLKGGNPSQSYKLLLREISKGVGLKSLVLTLGDLSKTPIKEQVSSLRNLWQSDQASLAQSGVPKIQQKARDLASDAIKSLEETRLERLAADYSVEHLRDDYQALSQSLIAVQKVAESYTLPVGNDDNTVMAHLTELDKARFNRQSMLASAIGAIQKNLDGPLQQDAHKVAIQVLRALEVHCAQALRLLGVLMSNAQQERKTQPRWGTSDPALAIHLDHPLSLPALTSQDEIRQYYNQLSIFTTQLYDEDDLISSIRVDSVAVDPLVDFRQWLVKQKVLDVFFKGNYELLVKYVQRYAQEMMQKKREKRPFTILDVLQSMGSNVLQDRLAEASRIARPLLPFSAALAPESTETRHLSALYNEEQAALVQEAMNNVFGQGESSLLPSNDPTEIVVFYYVDGLPMSAIRDLTGRCLEAFLKRRKIWYRRIQEARAGRRAGALSQRVGVPVYSGRDSEALVCQQGIIRALYEIKGENVSLYTEEDVPELGQDCLDLSSIQNVSPLGSNNNGQTANRGDYQRPTHVSSDESSGS